MTPSKEELIELRELCSSSAFAHSEEIVQILADTAANAQVLVSSVQLQSLRAIYRTRAEHLTNLEQRGELCAPSARSGRILPASLAEDVRHLSTGLDAARDQLVQIWHIERSDRTCYGLFVLMDEKRIVGACKSVSEPHEGAATDSWVP